MDNVHFPFLYFCIISFCLLTTVTSTTTLCKTPNGEDTQCISLYSCPILLKALGSLQPSSLEFVRQSQCGIRGDFQVCCGSSSSFTQLGLTFHLSNNRTNSEDNEPPVWIWTGSRRQQIVDYLAMKNILPDKRLCGLQNAGNSREFPWVALLEKQTSDKRNIVCNGVLVSSRYVLTVVECLSANISVLLGRGGCSEDDSNCYKDLQKVDIEEEYIHPKYDIAMKLYNIALLRLSKEIPFSDHIKPICLPLEGIPGGGGEVVISGWGTTLQGNFVKKMDKVEFLLISKRECQELHQNLQVDEPFLCIKEVRKNKEFCFGHAGDPIMYLHKNQWFLEGIVSASKSCHYDLPVVGLNILEFMQWTLDNIRE